MNRLLTLIAGVFLLVSMAACGGGAPQPLPTLATLPDADPAPTENPVSDEAEEEAADDAAAPTEVPPEEPASDADANDAAADGELRSSFTGAVSGALAGELRRMIGVDLCVSVFTLTYNNTFSAGDDDLEANIMFTIRPQATVGAFAYDSTVIETQPVEVSASVNDPAGGADYTRLVSANGELTAIPAAPGEAYTGSFNIVLDNFDFINQADATGEVTLTGEFVQVVDDLCEVG